MELLNSDLEPVLARHRGNRIFEETLYGIQNPEALLCALGRYIYFNSAFGSGVANLGGEISAREDIFRNADEVGADVLYAAIDEFGDRGIPSRSTHRTLAEATREAAGYFFGYDSVAPDKIASLNRATREAVQKVRYGYGVNRTLDECDLFYGMGFHMSSEILAGDEFNILDRFLCTKHPDLVDHLKRTEVRIGELYHPAYYWISVHKDLEPKHFEYALGGANHAFQNYMGKESYERIKSWTIEGVEGFSSMQSKFMEHLTDR